MGGWGTSPTRREGVALTMHAASPRRLRSLSIACALRSSFRICAMSVLAALIRLDSRLTVVAASVRARVVGMRLPRRRAIASLAPGCEYKKSATPTRWRRQGHGIAVTRLWGSWAISPHVAWRPCRAGGPSGRAYPGEGLGRPRDGPAYPWRDPGDLRRVRDGLSGCRHDRP